MNNCIQQSQPEIRCHHVRAVTTAGAKISVSRAVFGLPTGSFHTHPCHFISSIIMVNWRRRKWGIRPLVGLLATHGCWVAGGANSKAALGLAIFDNPTV